MLDAPSIGDSCNIRVDGPDRVEKDDIPDNYLPVLGKKRVLFRIHLEGDLTASDQTIVDTWLDTVIAQTKGVLIDLQTDRFETATKSGQLEAQTDRPNDNGWMSFYVRDGESFYESGFEEMFRQISALMPEAIPTRWGYYEPLQGRVENGDITELVSSFKNETGIFMKAKTPFGHIFTSIPCKKTFENYHPKHRMRCRFLLGSIQFEIRPKMFSHPGDFSRLKALFEKLCVTLDVVYAEIVQTDHYKGWAWHGLPDHNPDTICVGNAYQSVWPDVLKSGRMIGNHHHLVTTDRFGNKPPRPPTELIAPSQGGLHSDGKPVYAPVFPFNFKYDDKRYIW